MKIVLLTTNILSHDFLYVVSRYSEFQVVVVIVIIIAASQSATHSQPVPSRPIQTYRPQVPVPPIDRGLTELGDKGEAIVKQVSLYTNRIYSGTNQITEYIQWIPVIRIYRL